MRMDWSTRSVVDLIEVTLMSAGTLSPTNKTKKKKTDRNTQQAGITNKECQHTKRKQVQHEYESVAMLTAL